MAERPVGAQHHRAERPGLVRPAGAQHDGPRAVGEDDGGRAVRRVDDGGERVGADEQDPVGDTGGDQARRGRQPVEEAGAHGGDVEGGDTRQAEPGGHVGRGGRADPVGRGGGQDDGPRPGVAGGVQRPPSGLHREVGGGHAGGDPVPGPDAGTGADPLVGGVEVGGEVVVGDHVRRHPASDTGQHRGPLPRGLGRAHADSLGRSAVRRSRQVSRAEAIRLPRRSWTATS